MPLLSHAIDEPSAYEVIVGEGAAEPNEASFEHRRRGVHD